jgi:glycosyltransferase involved in cell wall biosynthesis
LIRRLIRAPRAVELLPFLLRVTDRAPVSVRRPLGRALVAVSGDARSRDRPTGSTAAITRAVGLRALGRGHEARAFAVRAARSSGSATHLAMAGFLDLVGDDVDALEVLRSDRLPRDPAAARRWRLLQAEIAERIGRYGEALAAVDDALRLAPGDPDLERRRSALEEILQASRSSLEKPGGRSLVRTPGRILLLAHRALPTRQSGYTLRTQQSAAAQRDAGLDPHVLVLQGSASAREGVTQLAVEGVPYHRLAGTGKRGQAGTVRGRDTLELAAGVLEHLEPSAIQATTPFLVGRLGLALGRRFGLPVVHEVRGFTEDSWLSSAGESSADSEHYLITREAESACMLAADAVVTLGDAMKAEIVSRGVPADRIAIIPNVVDSERFVPGPRDTDLAREMGIADHELVIGYISSFQPYEDFETFLKAFELLRSRGRPVRGLWVGGEGAKLAAARRRVTAARLEGIVLLPGRVPHSAIGRYHRLIDIFVVPRADSRVARLVTPFKPFEAMATGRPVVVSRLEALLEIVVEGETGLSYEAGDPDDLADVLDRLIAQPELRRCLGEAARTWVVANRTMEQMGKRYGALYRRLGVAPA